MKKPILLALLIISIASSAQAHQHANSYSVQIATYRNLPNNFLTSAEAFGEVHTSQANGLTRVSIGSFSNRNEAQALLSQLKKAGYEDAFISHLGASSSPSSSEHNNPTSPSSEMAKFRNLSDAEKDRAVFVDGKLHLKEGNQFIPIP
ncbi:MAG: SPOR domain-containing protein [Gammaproteobacteria bacterium]